MTDLCIPISHLGDNQVAEVTVTIGDVKKRHSFRVEAFPWDSRTLVGERILLLKRMIESYDPKWELVQIYNPSPDASYIHVLFRLKKSIEV